MQLSSRALVVMSVLAVLLLALLLRPTWPTTTPPEFSTVTVHSPPRELYNSSRPSSKTTIYEARSPLTSRPLLARGVRGRVLNERARPVLGARITLSPDTGEPPGNGASDVDGFFSVKAESSLQLATYSVRIQAEGLADYTSRNIALPASLWRDLGTFRMQTGANLEGTVVAADSGKPIEGAEVLVTSMTEEPLFGALSSDAFGVKVRTGVDGNFRISGAQYAAVSIVVVANGFARAARESVHLSRDEKNVFRFALGKGTEVPGRIVDVEGQPIAHVSITATEIESSIQTPLFAGTNAGGEFVLKGVSNKKLRVRACHPQYAMEDGLEFPPDANNIAITLHRLGSAELLVLGPSGTPITDYLVSPRIVESGQSRFSTVAPNKIPIHSAPGDFGFVQGLIPGPKALVFQVEAAGFAHSFTEPFAVRLDAQPVRLFVRLDQGGTIDGVVIGDDAKPIAGASVYTMETAYVYTSPMSRRAMDSVGTMTASKATTGADGTFSLPLLHPGRYFLGISHARYTDTSYGPLDLRNGEVLKTEPIAMQYGSRISGTVRHTQASPMPVVVSVCAIDSGGSRSLFYETTAQRDGAFAVDRRLPPGKYAVWAGQRLRPDPRSPIVPLSNAELILQARNGEDMLNLVLDSQGK